MSVTTANTNASLSTKTITVNENADTITGLKTFNRGAAAPFAVDAASTKVANLDADKLDGLDSAAFAQLAAANSFSSATPIALTNAAGGIKERNRSFQMGEWQAPAFNAADFTASAGNWTVAAGDVLYLKYTLIGKTMMVAFDIQTTTLSGTPTNLRIAIPGGFSVAAGVDVRMPGQAIDNGGAAAIAMIRVVAGTSYISIFKDYAATGTFAVATDNTGVRGVVMFEVS